ncbi:DJ-1/PfpI family protein [Candidatus Woesearchaeota archaeon]|nr:DJ-1/PfpI family protein [Candidatus Woesearchaeota archaeon]
MKRLILLIVILISIFSFGCAKEEAIQMDASGKKILMIIAPDGFRDEEFLEPKQVFESANAEVTVASKGVKVAKGKLGATADVDIDISEVDALNYDAVVFIGGPGTPVYFNDPAAQKIAKDAYSADKVVAAICIAPSILANSGVLKEHKATCFESESENVNKKSAGYTGDLVTVDGKVVTGNGPEAATKFAQEIVKLLG